MGKKNVVSIEDRIPTLKQERKKKANRRLVFYLSIFFFLITIIVYLQSPLSDVRAIHINGNSFVNDDQIMQALDIAEGTNIWTVNKQKIREAAASIPAVRQAEVQRKLPWTIELSITEVDHVGYVIRDDDVYPVLANGKALSERPQSSVDGNAPLLAGFSEEVYLQKMVKELSDLSESIRNLISEIHWKPDDGNKYKILLYMSDGNVVDGTIRHFADKMSVYPSIVSQLGSDKNGIIHIGVGAYFEEFDSGMENEGKIGESANESQ
ncbi:cell division protein FtsQ/DivIB [Lentibacillus lipolyticus]|nr:cell division protein FtsQ/DivIB [Lentibacillus lipolyticus]